MSTRKTYGLVGRNISYSLSPCMHNAAFNGFNIPAEYKLFDIEEKDLSKFFTEEVLSGNLSGFNVTVPYKVKMKALAEECSTKDVSVDPTVNLTGALNTIRVGRGALSCHNTDISGFCYSLVEDADFDAEEGKKFFVLGAGGAGRAISLFLASRPNSEEVKVYDIDKEKVFSLREDFKKFSMEDKFFEVEDGAIGERVKGCDLVVNATPLGTREGDASPLSAEYIEEGTVVYDLVYVRETELISQAKKKGLVASNGLGMLVNQAALSFEIWTAKPLERVKDLMKKAALEELEKRKRG